MHKRMGRKFMKKGAPCDSLVKFKERMERKTALDPEKEPRVAFPMKKPGDLYRIYRGEKEGHFYSRFGSAAEGALRERLVLAEAGFLEDIGVNPNAEFDSLVFPSGMAAITSVAMELARRIPIDERKGMKFIQGNTVYYNTNTVLSERMQEMGLEAALRVDTTNVDEVEKALKENKGKIVAIFYETVTNPLLEFTDTRRISELAERYGVPVIVDNTFLTPFLQQPLRLGADIVIHSMTKYISGYGDVMGGAVVGPRGFIDGLRTLQFDHGSVLQSTEIAKLFLERLGKLHERMMVHIRNADEIAEFLKTVEMIERLFHPKLSERDTRDGSPGAVMSFILKGRNSDEKDVLVREVIRKVVELEGPVTYKASLGEEGHLIEENDHEKGLVRFAVGRIPDAKEAIEFLKEVFRRITSIQHRDNRSQ